MTMRPGHRHGWAATTGAALLTLAVGVALAGAPPATRTQKTKPSSAGKPPAAVPARALPAQAPPAPAATQALPAPASPGLMAFIDPETGLLTGPIGQLAPPADQPAPEVLLEPVPLPGGGWMVDLRGTLREYYVLHVDALGRRSVTCVREARHAVAAPLVAPAPAGEER